MRNYFKIFRSPDFKTVVSDVPEGAEGWEKLAMEMPPRSVALQLYNRMAGSVLGVDTWVGYDTTLTTQLDVIGATALANLMFNCVPYAEHPPNDGPNGVNGVNWLATGGHPSQLPFVKFNVGGATRLFNNFLLVCATTIKKLLEQHRKRDAGIVSFIQTQVLDGKLSIPDAFDQIAALHL